MMVEINRFRKRFLSFRGSSVAINGGIGIVLVIYALFAISCVYFRGEFDPLILLTLFVGLMLFVIPLLVHSSIAGERERRSWEMLLVAPISHAQIIVGKFVGGFAGFGMAFGLFLIPVFIDAASYPNVDAINLLLGILTVIAQGASLIAMTLLISSRVKRPIIALAVSIAVVMVVFFFIPIFVQALRTFGGNFVTGMISPFEVLQRLSPNERRDFADDQSFSVQSLGAYTLVFGFLVYQLIITVSLLVWATKTLVYADHEVKFLSKSKRHA